MHRHLAGAIVLLAATASPQAPQGATQAEAKITKGTLAAHLRFLSHDLLEGRGVASRGDELARLYLETRFRQLGLEPGAEGGVWNQAVPVLGITSKVTQTLGAKGSKGTASFEAPADFTATAAAPLPETDWDAASLVFVGYGIEAPEQQWDDFKGVDLKGKVVLVMNNDPSDDPALFAGKTRLYYGRWTYKYEEAARRGAIGAIVIHTEVSAGYPFQVIQGRQGKEEFYLPFSKSTPALPIRSWCSEDAAKKLCALGGHDLDALRKQAETRAFQPVDLGVKLDLRLANTQRELLTGNVVAKLPGSDPAHADEAVVVTAHFDHLGIGPAKKGDSIYNGALDNASGTAAMLALAEACAALPKPPARTIYFVGCTGEESGLFGSDWFAQHPPIPRRKLVANYNIDGINVWGRTKDVQLIGYGKSSLTALMEQVAATRGREVRPDSQPELGLFYRSDHFSFARIGVPSVYMKAGDRFLENPEGKSRVKAMFTTVHYHQPSDEFDERWDLSGGVDDLQLLFECLVRTADDPQEPTWTKGDEFERLRDAVVATKSDFARFRRVDKDNGFFETAIVGYRNADGVEVDLVGAVHIADQAHYDALNKEFEKYDALLYELVAPLGTVPDKNRPRGMDPLTMLQQGLKNGLQLSFQLDGVNYKAANFVHADLSPQEFAQTMKERGESFLGLFWNAMMSGMAQQQNTELTQVDLVKAFRNKQGRHTLRMSLAGQLTDLEAQAAGFAGGRKNGSTLVEGRNDKALSVLDREIAAGKKRLAIYYGAAHMTDMEKKLLAKGFTKIGERWLVAWDVTKRPDDAK